MTSKPDGWDRCPDIPADVWQLIERVRPYTMTGPERIFALVEAVRYVIRAKIPGDIVECGVWLGGSMMAVASTLAGVGVTDRALYLYDAFAPMPEAGPEDRPAPWVASKKLSAKLQTAGNARDVFNLVSGTGHRGGVHVIAGMVEDTIPGVMPERIALLRLDTDYYRSTWHELLHLYPRLSPGGVLIVDDYGYWQGCRLAVDTYFAPPNAPVFLHRIDHTARLVVKP